MDIDILLRGIVIGLAIAAPVGAIGLLCIRRTLSHGRAMGLATGMGAATADAVYGAIAAIGIGSVVALAEAWESPLRTIGGVILVILGVRMARSGPTPNAEAPGTRSLVGAWAGTTVLTLTNPSTIFAFLAIFAGTGGKALTAPLAMTTMVTGVFIGSALWWLGLTWVIDRGRGRLSIRVQHRIGAIAGIVIAGIGTIAICSALAGRLGRIL